MITWENYEEYIMMHGDGELSQAEEVALTQFIRQHPELKSELTMYNSARLAPDETLVYPGKDRLLKHMPGKRTIIFPHWQRYSIAAGVAALVFISLFNWGGGLHSEDTVAAKNKTVVPLQNILPATPQDTVTKSMAAVQDKNVARAKEMPLVRPNIGKPYTTPMVAKTRDKINNYTGADEIAVSHTLDKVAISEVLVPEIKEIPVMRHTEEVAALVTLPVVNTIPEVNDREEKQGFLNKLPLDEANRSQVKTITKAVKGAYKHIKRISIKFDQESVAINF